MKGHFSIKGGQEGGFQEERKEMESGLGTLASYMRTHLDKIYVKWMKKKKKYVNLKSLASPTEQRPITILIDFQNSIHAPINNKPDTTHRRKYRSVNNNHQTYL